MTNTLQSLSRSKRGIWILVLLAIFMIWTAICLPVGAAEVVEEAAAETAAADSGAGKPMIDWVEVRYVTVQLLAGFRLTLALFFLTLICALPLGLVFAFGTMSKIKPIRWLVKGFVYIIRGTPLLLQLMIIVYIPGIVFHYPRTRWAIFGGNVPMA